MSSSVAHLYFGSLGRIGCIGTSAVRRLMAALLIGLSILAPAREAGAVEIHFDTRFDGGFISQHPERLRTLELAADIWGSLLTDQFAPVPPGTRVRMDNPRTGETLAVPMPAGYGDLLVFIFTDPSISKAWAKLLSSRTDGYEAGRSAFSRAPRPGTEMIGDLYRRANGTPHQPWACQIAFTDRGSRPWFFAQSADRVDDLPNATHYDFLTTALHELGHCLGIYLDGAPFSFTDLVRRGFFTGRHATALVGHPIPLAGDSSHVGAAYHGETAGGRMLRGRPSADADLMQGVDPIQGYREYPSQLDLAMLEDIGFTVDWARFRPSPYVDKLPLVQVQAPRSLAGRWRFTTPQALKGADVGYPVLYSPGSTGVIESLFDSDHIQIPHGAFLFVDHGMAANGGGSQVNLYTMLFDVRLPRLGVSYALMNTNPANANAGDVWINPAGQVGQGSYSQMALRPEVWYRVVFTADMARGERKYYINGALVHRQTDKNTLDGRFGIYATGSDQPFFTLFADSNGESAPIDVRQVAVWNYTLTEDEVVRLGGPDGGF